MSEMLLSNNKEISIDANLENYTETSTKQVKAIGRITVLELLAEPTEELTSDMTWQSAWTNKEDK